MLNLLIGPCTVNPENTKIWNFLIKTEPLSWLNTQLQLTDN